MGLKQLGAAAAPGRARPAKPAIVGQDGTMPTLTAGPRDCAQHGRRGSSRGCRSASWTHRHGRGVPEQCGCRSRPAAGGWQSWAAEYAVQGPRQFELLFQRQDRIFWKYCNPVLGAFTFAHDDFPPFEIDILDPEAQTCEYPTVQKNDRRPRLTLRGRRDFSLDSQVREKRLDLRGPHITRVPSAVEEDEATNPVDVDVFCTQGVVQRAKPLTELVDQLGRLGAHRRRSGDGCVHGVHS